MSLLTLAVQAPSPAVPEAAQTPLGLLAFVLVSAFAAIAATRSRGLQRLFAGLTALVIVVTGVYIWRGAASAEAQQAAIKAQVRSGRIEASRRELRLTKGETPRDIGGAITLQLVDVETLKGKRENGRAGTGHDRNRSLPEAESVLRRVMEAVEPNPTPPVARLLAMREAEWERFLDQQDPAKREQIKETPFARIVARHKGNTLWTRWVFRGEDLEIAGANATWTIAHVFNTRGRLVRRRPSTSSRKLRARNRAA